MRTWFDQLVVARRLGIRPVVAVILHRWRSKRGAYETLLPVRNVVSPRPFWEGMPDAAPAPSTPGLAANVLARAEEICAGKFRRYTSQLIDEGTWPAWFKGIDTATSLQHFSQVPINATPGADIKQTWDLSRFHWATDLAIAAAITQGENRKKYVARLQQLCVHWLTENGYQRGANWACSHEVALRGMQLMLSSLVLKQHVGLRPSPQLLDLLQQSWQRVKAVQAYSRAQQNNHSLAEHLFLIYGAEFLSAYGVTVADTATREQLKRGLAPLMNRLILKDGGCNMYSTNYHRVFCDMVAFAKLFDEEWGVGLFAAASMQHHAAGLARFLRAIIEPISGEAPLIGHNDGSLHGPYYAEYHQYEPALLLLSALFGLPVPPRAKRNLDAVWLFGRTLQWAASNEGVSDTQFDDSGLLVIAREGYRAYVKYPRNRFRPQQVDFLHLDLWVQGRQLLRDSGTYSYNAATRTRADNMGASHAHCMPVPIDGEWLQKLSPFLYRYWPNAVVKKPAADTWHFRYRNGSGATIYRQILFERERITITDQVTGEPLWGVTFNGVIEEGKEDMTAILGETVRVRFINLLHVSLAGAKWAPNYGEYAPSKRLVAEPADADHPLITTLTFGA